MATFAWTWQGTTPTTIDATDKIQFAGGTFDSAIEVDAYNSSSHVKTSGAADKSAANTPRNNKFISQTGGTAGDSQADWGDGTEDIDDILQAECGLKLNFSHASAVAVSGWKLYAYDGTTPATAPANMDVRLAELADIIFTQAEGSAAALTLADGTSSTSHDRYIIASVSPSTVGIKTACAFGTEITYQ